MKMLVVDGVLPPARRPQAVAAAATMARPVPALTPARPVPISERAFNRSTIAVIALLLFALLGLSVQKWQKVRIANRPLHFTETHVNRAEAAAAAKATSAPASSAQLASAVNDFLAGQPTPYFLVVQDLKYGQVFTSHDQDVITSASLYKLFVANQTYRMIDQGAWTYGTPAGDSQGRTIDQCLNAMITVSDNDCGNALGDKLGWQQQATSLQQQGYTSTNLGASPTTTNAHDVGLLLQNLYAGKFLSSQSQNHFLNLLKNQQVNDRLPQGLPAGTPFAHKTGELDGYMHDAGIVFGPKSDYVIVAMAGPWQNNSDSFAPDAQLSQIVYNTLQK